MIILPAIDIQGGCCVRLYQGDFATAHQVAENPLETALSFRDAGAAWIHMVDLDGAKARYEGTGFRKSANAEIFLEVAKSSGLQVELGGGIRDMETISYYLENGISRVILGSAAVKNPALVREAVEAFKDRIAVGIDAKDGLAATEGWLGESGIHYVELAKQMEQIGVKYIIFTDIAKDGMQQGVNREQLQKLADSVGCNLIASGGVRDLDDVHACKAIGLYGMICGKSIYAGSLSLREAVAAGGSQRAVREGEGD